MIPRTLPLVLVAALVFVGTLLAPLRAEVEFTGLLAMKDNALFQLADRAAGTSSGWIALKGTFAGYTLSAYDPKEDSVSLTKDGTTTKLRLNASKVQSAKLEIRGTINLTAGEKIEFERATLAFDQDNSFPLKNGIVLHLTPSLRPDNTLLFQASFERTRPDGSIEKLSSPTVNVLPNMAFSIEVGSRDKPQDNLGFSFTPTVE